MNILLTPYPLLVNAAGQESTVDHQGVPGNERCGVGAKIDRSSDDFFSLAEMKRILSTVECDWRAA